MSKCREAYELFFGVKWEEEHPHCNGWQAAWNARGKVDAEICRAERVEVICPEDEAYNTAIKHCAEAIEKGDEK